jgi:hypothetical protein
MANIIFWASMIIVHIINARLWKKEPTSFWYKLSWFLMGWCAFATLHYIGEYLSA